MATKKPFIYITDLTELKARINAVEDPKTARIEVRLTGTRILPKTKMFLRICSPATTESIQAQSEGDPIDINDSRICPPICPAP